MTDWFDLSDTYGARFNADASRVLFSSGSSGWALLWDVAQQTWAGTVRDHYSRFEAAAFSPDGKCFVTCPAPGTWQIFGSAAAELITPPVPADGLLITAVFSPDSTRLLAGYNTGIVAIRCARSGVGLADPMEHPHGVERAAFNRSGTRVMTVLTTSQATRLWDAGTGAPVTPWLPQTVFSSTFLGRPNAWALGPAFSPDGRSFLTASEAAIRIFDTAEGRQIGTDLTHGSPLRSAAWSPDSRRVLIAETSGAVHVWDAATGIGTSLPLRETGRTKTCFSPDGSRIVTELLTDNGLLRCQLWDAGTLQPIGEPRSQGGWPLAFSPDGRRWASGGLDLHLFDLGTGALVSPRVKSEGNHVVFNRDGSRLLIASSRGKAALHDGTTGELIASLDETAEIWSGGFSPCGRLVVTATNHGTARIWNAVSGEPEGPLIDFRTILQV